MLINFTMLKVHILLLFFVLTSGNLFAFVQSDSISGDFNGDGKQEYAWVTDETDWENFDTNNCVTVHFSTPKIPPLCEKRFLFGYITNLNDLNGDRTDELLLRVQGESGAWHVVYLYTLQKGKWVKLKGYGYNEYDGGGYEIRKHPTEKGAVVFDYNAYGENGKSETLQF